VICEWPAGTRKPMIPLTYAQETMHGFEYAAAVLMIMRGYVDEGTRIVEAVRDRYDGEKRNPWNEFECGSNYARSMASYALLNAFSGFEFDMRRKMIGFRPRVQRARFRCLWSLDAAWGTITLCARSAMLEVLGGEIALQSVRLPFAATSARIGGRAVRVHADDGESVFASPVRVTRGSSLRLAG
jgi:non-lysosomal glucosylceramidase